MSLLPAPGIGEAEPFHVYGAGEGRYVATSESVSSWSRPPRRSATKLLEFPRPAAILLAEAFLDRYAAKLSWPEKYTRRHSIN